MLPDRCFEMPNYLYRAIAPDTSIETGKLRAESEFALERTLTLRGLTLIEARSIFALPTFARSNWRRFSDSDLLELTYLLMLVNSSGVPLLGGMKDVLAGQRKGRLIAAFEALSNGLSSGLSLSDVMRSRPEIFPEYYSQIINAGEASGTLDKSLDYLMVYLEWQIEFKKSILAFFRYPIVILLMMGALSAILLTVVFPSLGGVLNSLKVEMPLPTVIIFSLADFVRSNIIAIVLFFVFSAFAARFALSTTAGRFFFDRWILELPLVGDLIKKINLSRYFKTLATLMAAGLNVQKAFAIAAEVVNNVLLKKRLMHVTHAVTAGEEVSAAFRETQLVSPLVISMVVIAEKTGNLDGALARASEIFDKEVPETIKRVFAVVEPLSIVMLGCMLLVILLSIFLPMYSVVGNIHVR